MNENDKIMISEKIEFYDLQNILEFDIKLKINGKDYEKLKRLDLWIKNEMEKVFFSISTLWLVSHLFLNLHISIVRMS